MADQRIVNYMRRFFSRDDIESAYRSAGAASQARQTEITIESASGEGGTTSARWTGDPLELMEACEDLLAEMDAADDGIATTALGTTHIDFSRRYIGT